MTTTVAAKIAIPSNVVIVVAPAPTGKVAAVVAEKTAVAQVSRAINAAYYNGVL